MKKYLSFFLILFFIIGCADNQKIEKQTTKKRKVYNDSAKVEVVSHDFLTENALHDAVRANDLELVQFLLSQGVQKDQQDEYGYTPLHLAVRLHNLEIVQYLLSKGVNVNTMDKFKDTPLIDSTRNNDTEISKELICNGAERNVADKHNMSTLHNSSKNNNKYISELLRADHVEPYCQAELEIDIQDTNTEEICGNILKGFATNLIINLEDSNGEYFGDYNAHIDNTQHTWCVDISDKSLASDLYTINATANDYVVNEATATKSMDMRNDEIAVDQNEPTTKMTPTICGDIVNGDIQKVDLYLEDESAKKYGKYESIIYLDEKRWCADVTDPLALGIYNITAKAYNEVEKEILATGDIEILDPALGLGIALDDLNSAGKKPKICGNITKGEIETVDVILNSEDSEFGPYKANVDKRNKRWCANTEDELPNGKYSVNAIGYDSAKNKTEDNGELQVFVIPGLYEALQAEFKDDFDPWQAEVDKDTLTWRFKNPTVLFKLAKKDLRKEFKNILDDFFPRYIKVLKSYQKDIENVIVEGHSSSEHRLGKNLAQKYKLNQELSQKRANEVLEYAKASSNPNVMSNIMWILNNFSAKGMSSSQLVYNPDGTENKELSRRVEFRIETKLNN